MVLKYLFEPVPKPVPRRKQKIKVDKAKIAKLFAALGNAADAEIPTLLGGGEDAITARNLEAAMQNVRKALSAHYGLLADTPEATEKLYFYFVQEMGLPSAQIATPQYAVSGRPKNPDNHSYAVLDNVAAEMKKLKKPTVAEACRRLTKKERKARYHELTARALVALHGKTKRRFKKEFGYDYGSPQHQSAKARQSLLGS